MCEQRTRRAGVDAGFRREGTFRKGSRLRRVFAASTGLCLVLALSGCISTERPDLAVDIPPAYRTAHGMSPAGRPALDWWRGFRSAELTKLMEEAQTANFDIAAAIARITQADAQSKIVGAALLPAVNLNGTAARSRSSQANGGGGGWRRRLRAIQLQRGAQRQLRDRLLGQEPRALARRTGKRHRAHASTATPSPSARSSASPPPISWCSSSQDRLRTARENVAAASRVLTLIQQRFEAGTAVGAGGGAAGEPWWRRSVPPFRRSIRRYGRTWSSWRC